MKPNIYQKLIKASPYFLYLFIPGTQVNRFPIVIRQKRSKALQIAISCAKALNISIHELMDIMYNGIIQNYDKTPKEVITDMMEGNAYYIAGEGKGKGLAETFQFLQSLLNSISKLFKKAKTISTSIKDSPMYDDFKGIAKDLTSKVFKKGSKSKSTTQRDRNTDYSYQTKRESTTDYSNQYEPEYNDYSRLSPVRRTNKSSMNGLLFLGLLLGGLFLATRKKKKK